MKIGMADPAGPVAFQLTGVSFRDGDCHQG
jgi:hypothetical protein